MKKRNHLLKFKKKKIQVKRRRRKMETVTLQLSKRAQIKCMLKFQLRLHVGPSTNSLTLIQSIQSVPKISLKTALS